MDWTDLISPKRKWKQSLRWGNKFKAGVCAERNCQLRMSSPPSKYFYLTLHLSSTSRGYRCDEALRFARFSFWSDTSTQGVPRPTLQLEGGVVATSSEWEFLTEDELAKLT